MNDWVATFAAFLDSLFAETDAGEIGYTLLIGAAVFAMTFGIGLLLYGLRDPMRNRIESTKKTGLAQPAGADGSKLGKLVQALGAFAAPRKKAGRQRVEARLRYAGFRSEGAPRLFYGLKLTGLVLFPLLLLGVSLVSGSASRALFFQFWPFAAGIGFLLPDLVLRSHARRRQDRLRRGLPDAMDLLVVCSEAGLGLTAAIQRVAGELDVAHPELSDELNLFSLQTRAGMDSRAALKDLEERNGLDDIQVLVSMLLQSMRFGTSIASTLRICADDLRDKRVQRAQEKAARISTWILFPLVFCVLPSFFIVTLGPAVLGAIRALSGSDFL